MKDTKKAFLPVWTFAKIDIRRAFRDKVALFFIFLFPLIFLFVFGGIFGRNSDVSFRVAFINQSENEFAKQFTEQAREMPVLKIDPEVNTPDDAYEKISRGQIDALILLPEDFGALNDNGQPSGEAVVQYTQNDAQAGQTLTSILQESVFKEINAQFVQTDMPFTVVGEQRNERSLRQFDYTFAGLLGFSIIGLGIFGPVNVFPQLKKQQVLRRLHTTPLRVWQYFLAIVISNSVVGLMSLATMFIVAMIVFKLQVIANPIELVVFLVLSIITILGIGLAIGGWAKNENQAAPLSNIVVFPMMFLSGTFFPRFAMPEWLQTVSGFLPLTPVIDGVRLMVTEGKHLIDLGPQIGLMFGWLVIIYIIAFRVFRWE